MSVAIDQTIVDDPAATGTFTVKNVNTGTSYQNSTLPVMYEPWDVIEITIYPQSGYMTYGFVDAAGNVIPTYDDMDDFLAQGDPKVGGLLLNDGGNDYPQRLSEGQFRTVWRYVVGCHGIDLKAVMAKKRFHVEAYVNPTILGSITSFAAAFPVAPHPIVIDGDPVLFGFWDEDQSRLGFVATPVIGAKKNVEGYFEKGSTVNVVVNETAATPTRIPEFDKWMKKVNGSWEELEDGKSLTKDVTGDAVY